MKPEVPKHSQVIQKSELASETKIESMYRIDTILVMFWIVALWITLISVYLSVAQFAPGFSKPLALVIGSLLGIFATAALIAVNSHLKKNKTKLYTEDILCQEINQMRLQETDIGLSVPQKSNLEKSSTKQHITESLSTEATDKRYSFMKVFDIFFILVLCYLSLLLPILLRGTVIVGSGESVGMDYSFDPLTFVLVVSSFLCYIIYVLRNSNKELRVLVDKVYGKRVLVDNVYGKKEVTK